jgi:anhydro-N-acetylmuramic acid kinase
MEAVDGDRRGRSLAAGYDAKREHLVIGIMSGTSLDGVDATLVRILTREDGSTESLDLVKHSYIPYSDEMRSLVSRLCSVETARVDDLVYAHYGLSEWYAAATELVLREAGIPASAVDAVSMHGQTVWHAPITRDFPGPGGNCKVKGTLQLGSSAVVSERTGIPVISDLRARDMAAGGEGAPLAPYIDAILFGSRTEGRIVQNIGGIGNATVVPAGASSSGILAFDTGPGNMIIDGLVRLESGGKTGYDEGGGIAATGKVSEALVEELMRDPYFSRRPPKSTGREIYGAAFAEAFMRDARGRGLSFADAVATATAFTAESIARAYRDFVLPSTPIARVVVCGGGAFNATLLAMLASRLGGGIAVETGSALGVPDQAREAMAFALLGHESLMGRPSNLPAVTGARRAVILGTITL